MELRDYLAALRRHILTIIVLTALGVGAGAALTVLQKPVYQSTARVLIAVRSSSSISDIATGANLATTIVNTYSQVAVSPYVLNGVIQDAKLSGENAAQLANRVTTATSTSSTVLDVTVSDGSPRRAAEIANGIMRRLADSSDKITPTANGVAPVQLTVIQAATAPVQPSSPVLPLNLLVGGLVGLAIAATFSILREALDTRVKTISVLRAATDAPVLGRVYRSSGGTPPVLETGARESLVWTEAFQALRTNLDFVDFGAEGRSIVVTSSVEGEGKSTVAANLAVALADAGESVVLVDADLRRPTLAGSFGVIGDLGLADVLANRTQLEDALQSVGERDLMLLPAGSVPPNPGELLRGQNMIDLLEVLHERFGVVIFDTPPLVPVSDAALLARRTAGALLVASVGKVRRPQLATAVEKLDQVGARVFGVVANRLPDAPKDPYSHTQRPVRTAAEDRTPSAARPKLGDAPSR